jgi:hypothetical protein
MEFTTVESTPLKFTSVEEPKGLLSEFGTGFEESHLGMAGKNIYEGLASLIAGRPISPANLAQQPEAMSPDAPFMSKLARSTGTLAGDLPGFIVNALPGAVMPMPYVMAPASALGLTEGQKELMRMPSSTETAVDILKRTGVSAGKGAVVGATMGALTGGIPQVVTSGLRHTALPLGLAGGTVVGAGMEGQAPTVEEIALTMIPLMGLHYTAKGVTKAVKAAETKGKAALLEHQTEVAEKAGIPAVAPQAAVPGAKVAESVKLATPASALQKRRRSRQATTTKGLEESISEQKTAQENFNAMLKTEKDKALDDRVVIREDEVEGGKIVSEDPHLRYTELGLGEEKTGLSQTQLELKEKEPATSVQKLDKGQLTSEEWDMLRKENGLEDMTMDQIKAQGKEITERIHKKRSDVDKLTEKESGILTFWDLSKL